MWHVENPQRTICGIGLRQWSSIYAVQNLLYITTFYLSDGLIINFIFCAWLLLCFTAYFFIYMGKHEQLKHYKGNLRNVPQPKLCKLIVSCQLCP